MTITDGALSPDSFGFFLISEIMDITTAAEREVQMAAVFQFENKKNRSFITLLSFHLNFSKWEILFSVVGLVKLYKLLLNKQQDWAIIQTSLHFHWFQWASLHAVQQAEKTPGQHQQHFSTLTSFNHSCKFHVSLLKLPKLNTNQWS